MEDLIKIFSALLTPIIAIVTTYIAVQQYRLSKFKVRHELFERRLAVYKAVMEFISSTSRHKSNVDESAVRMIRETADSYFIFKTDIAEYIRVLYDKGIDLSTINLELSDPTMERGERKLKSKERSDMLKWFGQQYDITSDKFRKYLALES
jgi:hypothetical protein